MDAGSTILAIHHDTDPSAAVVRAGHVLAYSEEERHARIKHAPKMFPAQSIKSCLQLAKLHVTDIDYVAINWDLAAFTDGRIQTFYSSLRSKFPVDSATIHWQDRNINARRIDNYRTYLQANWIRHFGVGKLPEIVSFPHHYVHAFQAHMQSSFDESLCVTLDGSGDTECTVLWRCKGSEIVSLRKFEMPNSLGWFYAAITEYLGFDAKDGEYKVMGMGAYGKPQLEIKESLSKVISIRETEGSYSIDPTYIHYGPHSYSGRYTDKLVELFNRKPRHRSEENSDWHYNLAFETQAALEAAVAAIIAWGVRQTGIRNICISGGVGLNVKMNSHLLKQPFVSDIFAHPLCSDNGAVCGAGLLASHRIDGANVKRLRTLSLGHYESPENVRRTLLDTKTNFEEIRHADIASRIASELEKGRIIGWFQGKMEAGPRALGHRSILADPRTTANRDKVNAIIKYREPWRPFCPSMLVEAVDGYFSRTTRAPFMIVALDANDRLKQDAPAIVHIDGTSRIQAVSRADEPLFYDLISEFSKLTNVPVLLNTSFNVAGEPIVCTALDALRTFWSTALDVLAIENFIVTKPGVEN